MNGNRPKSANTICFLMNLVGPMFGANEIYCLPRVFSVRCLTKTKVGDAELINIYVMNYDSSDAMLAFFFRRSTFQLMLFIQNCHCFG